jgi:hypothetical protein
VLVADAALESGGPAPGPSDGPLQLRQRVLAEAALQSVAGDPPGLVFVPSDDWDPGPGTVGADLFDQLDTPWTYTASLPSLDGPGARTRVGVAEVRAAPPLPTYVLRTAAALRRRARIYEAVTGTRDTLLPYYEQAAALALSSELRSEPETSRRLVQDSRAAIDERLDQITVEGPEFVTLSSDAGFFPITLTNRLDHPVRVGAVISDDDGLLTVVEVEPQVLEPRSQVTLTVSVEAPSVGVTDGQGAAGHRQRPALRRPRRVPPAQQHGRHRHLVRDGSRGRLRPPARLATRRAAAASRPPSTGARSVSHRAPEPASGAQGRSLLSASAVMAAGTVVSRLTGFARAALIIAAIGKALDADLFTQANTIPNSLYILVAGGVLNVVLVPQLVRSMRNDPDGGRRTRAGS